MQRQEKGKKRQPRLNFSVSLTTTRNRTFRLFARQVVKPIHFKNNRNIICCNRNSATAGSKVTSNRREPIFAPVTPSTHTFSPSHIHSSQVLRFTSVPAHVTPTPCLFSSGKFTSSSVFVDFLFNSFGQHNLQKRTRLHNTSYDTVRLRLIRFNLVTATVRFECDLSCSYQLINRQTNHCRE